MLSLKEKVEQNKTGFKGVGNLLLKTAKNEQWNILKENVSLPALTITNSVMEHNQLWMDRFLENQGFQLAPHGKTTMMPKLFDLQLSSNFCWGITLATAYQSVVAHEAGVKRVIMANQLVGKCNMDIISSIIKKDPSFEFVCLVDSPTNVEQLGKFFLERKQKINVLIEYGPMGGRTGVRNDSQEDALVKELEKFKDTVVLRGIEFFEGVLSEEEGVRKLIKWALSRVPGLLNKNIFVKEEIMVTGAGTSWLDVVAEELRQFEQTCSRPLKKILRSGCYLIYDNGMYEKMEQRVSRMKLGDGEKKGFEILKDSLKPALKIWAYVHSIPEKDLAIIGFGKRDAMMDCGYPVPYQQYRPAEGTLKLYERNSTTAWKVFKMMDQHTFMRVNEGDDLQVGDILSFDIYHVCTTMDKWRNVLLIDDDHNVVDVLKTEF